MLRLLLASLAISALAAALYALGCFLVPPQLIDDAEASPVNGYFAYYAVVTAVFDPC